MRNLKNKVIYFYLTVLACFFAYVQEIVDDNAEVKPFIIISSTTNRKEINEIATKVLRENSSVALVSIGKKISRIKL